MTVSYSHLAGIYDRLFPLDPGALSLVEETWENLSSNSPSRRVVDAGCGTGLLARALGDRGFSVFAFDLDPDLLAQARARSGRGVVTGHGDLRSWTLPKDFGRPPLLVCFGNTLAHLTSEGDLGRFLECSARQLAPQAVLLLQVLDYDRLSGLVAGNQVGLPEIEGEGWVFRRRYVVNGPIWEFHTSLEGRDVRQSGVFPLRPWKRAELEAALARSGYALEAAWGGFDRSPVGSSLPLVLKARLTLK